MGKKGYNGTRMMGNGIGGEMGCMKRMRRAAAIWLASVLAGMLIGVLISWRTVTRKGSATAALR